MAAWRRSRRRKFLAPISPASRSIWRPGASSMPPSLRFLDPPPRAALAEAQKAAGRARRARCRFTLTDEGRAMRAPPAAAAACAHAGRRRRRGQASLGAEIAVALTERGLGGDAVDLAARLRQIFAATAPSAPTMRGGSRAGWRTPRSAPGQRRAAARAPGAWLAAAFPDRIAKGARQARRIPDGERPRGEP